MPDAYASLNSSGWKPPDFAEPTETTTLSPDEESQFLKWISTNKVADLDNPDSHYDYRGYWKEFGNKPVEFGKDHFPDTYKQHGHPTFSVESKYSTGPDDGGTWDKDTFVPSKWKAPEFAEELKPEVPPEKSMLGDIWSWMNKPTTNIPSKTAHKVSEPLMAEGELGTSIVDKAKLYGGAYAQSIGNILDSLSSPLNIGLTTVSAGSNLAEGAGLSNVAKTLTFPGKVAGAGMVAHGSLGATDSSKHTDERLASAIEAVLGGASLYAHPNAEIPKNEPIPEIAPKIKPQTPKVKEPSVFEPGGLVERYVKAVESGQIPKEMPIAEFAKGTTDWKPPPFAEEKPSATYRGFQEDPTSPDGGFHLYDVNGGPLHGSTVSADTLKKNGIESPDIPEQDLTSELNNLTSQSNPIDMQGRFGFLDKYIDKYMGKKAKVPINPETDIIRNPVDSIDKLKNSIQLGLQARKQQDILYSAERARRAEMISNVETPGVEGYYERLGMLKGELPKIPVESQITQNDLDSLMDAITNSDLRPYEKINAQSGLVKLVSGQAPQKSEAALLSQVFGDDIGQLIELHGGFGAVPIGSLISDVVNVPKSLMSTADLSAPLRQGLPLITRGEYWRSFKNMFDHFGSEKVFQTQQEVLRNRPNFDLGDESGLHLSGLGDDLTTREEAFISPMAERLPIAGHLVKASERAYVGFLNQLRADVFDSLIKEAKALGHEPYIKEITQYKDGHTVIHTKPSDISHQIANFVNTATGRGNLGRFEKAAVELNAGFWSPRLVASRLTLLNPNYYIKADPFIRRQAVKALLSVAAAGMTTTALLKRAGAQVSDDPVSTDFGKAKFGNVRVDPYGGFQQYIVAANRLITGKSTSATGRHYDLGKNFVGPSRQSVAIDFMRSKESPLASFIDTMLQGDQAFAPSGVGGSLRPGMEKKGMSKTESRVSGEVINRYTPMIISDIVDVYNSDPDLLPLGILGAFGMGVQAFGSKNQVPMPVTQP